MYHMAVEMALLNLELDEELCARLPLGPYNGCHNARLRKDGYGLKQASKAWFMTSDAFIMRYDSRMKKHQVEPCLYYLQGGDLWVFLRCYVDDYLVASSSHQWHLDFVAAFDAQYACKDSGKLDLVMGIGESMGARCNISLI
eukprot:gene7228-biopygen7301